MKEGDKVITPDIWENLPERDTPQQNKIYTVLNVSPCGCGINLEELHTEGSGYAIQYWRRIESNGLTNSVTRELVKEFTENDKLRQIEKEKIFSLTEKF